MKGIMSMLALAVALAFTGPAFAGVAEKRTCGNNVRYWHKTDMPAHPLSVRYQG